MNKKQVALVITLIFYIAVGTVAAAGLFFLGSTGKVETAYSPSAVEQAEKEDALTAEEEEEAEMPVEEEPEILYYKFVTINRSSPLNVRERGNMESPVVGKLQPGTEGYVMEKGENWSRIKTEHLEGYASNEYLAFEEIPGQEHPYYEEIDK